MASESKNANVLEAAGAWSNEAEFLGAHDNVCMTASAAAVSGEFSFDFSAVSGDIDGIEVLIHRAWNGNDIANVELYDSTSTWRLKASATNAAADCASATDETLGTPTDLWGGTWTAAHISSSAFRIRLTSVTQGKSDGYWGADHCTVTVYYTAGVTEKGFADVGSGSDVFAKAITLLSKAFVDVVGGADVFSIPYRAMGFADTGSGADVLATLYREMGFIDSGAGADVFATTPLFIPKGFADTVGGSDAFTLLRFLDFIDAGAGADVISLTRPMYVTDVGGGIEVFSIPFKELPVADTGLGTDVFTTPFRAMGFADAGSGAEVFFLLVEMGFADVGAGNDVFIKSLITVIVTKIIVTTMT